MPRLPPCFWDLGWPGIFYVTCNLGWPQTHSNQTAVSWVLGIKALTTVPDPAFYLEVESFHWTSSWWTRLEGQQISEMGPMSAQDIVPKNGIGGLYNHVWLQCLALIIGSVALWVDGRQVTTWAPVYLYSYSPAAEDKTDTEVINNLFKEKMTKLSYKNSANKTLKIPLL